METPEQILMQQVAAELTRARSLYGDTMPKYLAYTDGACNEKHHSYNGGISMFIEAQILDTKG
jgi:hypothetical protein